MSAISLNQTSGRIDQHQAVVGLLDDAAADREIPGRGHCRIQRWLRSLWHLWESVSASFARETPASIPLHVEFIRSYGSTRETSNLWREVGGPVFLEANGITPEYPAIRHAITWRPS